MLKFKQCLFQRFSSTTYPHHFGSCLSDRGVTNKHYTPSYLTEDKHAKKKSRKGNYVPARR